MPIPTSHPPVPDPPGILNLLPSLLPTPPPAAGEGPARSTSKRPLDLPPLNYLLLADRLAELYALIFPDRPDWPAAELLDWADEEDVIAATEKFLGRVGALFPVYDEIWDLELETVEWRLYEIPVSPHGYDIWYDSWEDLKEPAPYLLHSSWSRGEQVTGGDRFEHLYPDHPLPEGLEAYRLIPALRQLLAEQATSFPAELAGLPDLLAMLYQETGNWWLDVGECQLAEADGYPPWQPETVELLAAEWREAQPMLERIMTLLNWQQTTPTAVAGKLAAVRELLLATYGSPPMKGA